uniref:Ground-like domain-containing protein n=1 Tax=Angiostrongylus costaricensis TaxID=334426 RepID=A0A0R3PXC1_ANGCS
LCPPPPPPCPPPPPPCPPPPPPCPPPLPPPPPPPPCPPPPPPPCPCPPSPPICTCVRSSYVPMMYPTYSYPVPYSYPAYPASPLTRPGVGGYAGQGAVIRRRRSQVRSATKGRFATKSVCREQLNFLHMIEIREVLLFSLIYSNSEGIFRNEIEVENNIILQFTTADSSESKRAIQENAEERLEVSINVICGRGEFSYVAHTEHFCQSSKDDITCYAFQPL